MIFGISAFGGDRIAIVSNIDPCALYVGKMDEGLGEIAGGQVLGDLKIKPFLHRGILCPWDFIFLSVPPGVKILANDSMFLWEIKLKGRGWRWQRVC